MKRASLALLAGVLALAARTGAAQETRNPHGKLQQECAVCHAPEAWVPARISSRFDHAKQGFALAGAHAQAACRSCHASLEFHGAPSDCMSCHKDVHRGELGTDCARCHTPRNFLDRSVMVRAHQLTRFALNGSHLTVDCEACHTPAPQGRLAFVNLPVQCVECHLPQYQAAKNPDHVASGFPQDCSQCHAVTIWTGGRIGGLNHTWFRIPHHGAQCSDCHTVATNYATFVCTDCHTQAPTTRLHQGVSGFVWNSANCYACHARGGG